MRDTEAERSIEISVTEYESELVTAFREIRDTEVAQMIGELVHVVSVSHLAEIIPISRKAVDLSLAGGKDTEVDKGLNFPGARELIDA